LIARIKTIRRERELKAQPSAANTPVAESE
jgi:hypothetical protein